MAPILSGGMEILEESAPGDFTVCASFNKETKRPPDLTRDAVPLCYSAPDETCDDSCRS